MVLLDARAQRFEIGAQMGTAGYIGDLNPSNVLPVNGPSFGAFVRLNFDPYWSLGIHYNYGKIGANDNKAKNLAFQDRNLNFSNKLHEFSFIGNFNFFDMYMNGSKKRFSPYLFAGLGGVIFNPTTPDANGKEVALRYVKYTAAGDTTYYSTEGRTVPYMRYTIVLPYGVGIKYKKNDNWTIFGQVGYRASFTDYLDDVSGVYPVAGYDKDKGGYYDKDGKPLPLIDRSGIAGKPGKFKPGDQRGDSRKFDAYLFVNVGISFTFVGEKCFTF